MPVLRIEDISRPEPELGVPEARRRSADELERIRQRALERGSSAEELALALALSLALARRDKADAR